MNRWFLLIILLLGVVLLLQPQEKEGITKEERPYCLITPEGKPFTGVVETSEGEEVADESGCVRGEPIRVEGYLLSGKGYTRLVYRGTPLPEGYRAELELNGVRFSLTEAVPGSIVYGPYEVFIYRGGEVVKRKPLYIAEIYSVEEGCYVLERYGEYNIPLFDTNIANPGSKVVCPEGNYVVDVFNALTGERVEVVYVTSDGYYIRGIPPLSVPSCDVTVYAPGYKYYSGKCGDIELVPIKEGTEIEEGYVVIDKRNRFVTDKGGLFEPGSYLFFTSSFPRRGPEIFIEREGASVWKGVEYIGASHYLEPYHYYLVDGSFLYVYPGGALPLEENSHYLLCRQGECLESVFLVDENVDDYLFMVGRCPSSPCGVFVKKG